MLRIESAILERTGERLKRDEGGRTKLQRDVAGFNRADLYHGMMLSLTSGIERRINQVGMMLVNRELLEFGLSADCLVTSNQPLGSFALLELYELDTQSCPQ
jgi:hypothetical protein